MPRILVIRGGAIGDFILTLPAIQLLREAFPAAELEIIGYQHIVALAEERFYATRTRSIEYGPMAGFFARNGNLSAELQEYFGGFQQIVSYLFDPDGIFEANLRRCGAKNVLSAFRKLDDSDHAARQLAHPLQALALYLEDPAARVYPAEEDVRAAAALAPKEVLARTVAIHPGSGSPRKNWPVERWATLGRRLCAEAPLETRLLLIGGEADAERLDYLRQAWVDLPTLEASGWLLPHLAGLLRQVRLFLGHDSGISHLAAATELPCLLLFGPTDPDVWAPANPGVQVLTAPEGDLAQLAEEEVWAAVQQKLQTQPMLD